MYQFTDEIKIIGINPYVSLPDDVLHALFRKNGKERGPIRVKGTINGEPYTQTLVKYKGEWRLYINTRMLKDSPRRIGERIDIQIDHNPEERTAAESKQFIKALSKNAKARKVFDNLAPSLQNEIHRYIASLKTEESVERNVKRAIDYLLGKSSFVGRKPIS